MRSTDVSAIVGLVELAHVLQSPDDWKVHLQSALERTHALLRAERTTLLLRHDGETSLYAYPSPAGDARDEPVAHLDMLLRDDGAAAAAHRAPAAHSHLAMPLHAGDEEHGMLLVERHHGATFDEHSLQLLSVIASQLGAYVSRCLLTERDRRLRDEEARLHDFQRLLVGIVSHDLRTPLAAILTGASLLLTRLTNERDAKVLGRMTNSAQRAVGIINDLLDLTRAQSAGVFPITPRHADAAAMAREVVDELCLAYPERTIVLQGADAALPVHVDPDRVAQALANLVSNAVQYGAATHPITVGIETDEATVQFSIHNMGAPIPPEMLPRMFDPFRRGTRRSTGLGLGLYIVEQIVAAHGGTADIESSAAAGTTFRIRLPRLVHSGQSETRPEP